MPIRTAPGTNLQYFLVPFDEQGRERAEPGGLLSDAVLRAVQDGVTDVFFMSHGWQGDVPAAIRQFDAWLGAMAQLSSAREEMERVGKFQPLIVGLHWPSLPWGDEDISPGTGGLLSAEDDPVEAETRSWASKIADTAEARDAIREILDIARANPEITLIPPTMRVAYAVLFNESGLQLKGLLGPPGADQDDFNPQAIIHDGLAAAGEGSPSADAGLLGVRSALRDALLLPLRQLSFWKMKDRARLFGETGASNLLVGLRQRSPDVRIHLMGHSFGCIVVSAAVATAAPRIGPAQTLFLVQGALSLWAYADRSPFAANTPGYFSRILQNGLIDGPIITTRSRFDRAVGFFYPLGARAFGQTLLSEYPQYGGLGAFGIQGLPRAQDLRVGPVTGWYSFEPGGLYNLDADDVIKNGGGFAGAHNDIAHPEIAQAFWAGVLVSATTAPMGRRGGPGVLGIDDVGPSAEAAPAREKGEPIASSVPTADMWEDIRPDIHDGFDVIEAGPPRPLPPAAPTERFINTSVEDHPLDQPLIVGTTYTLVFGIDEKAAASGLAPVSFTTDELTASDLTVQLQSDDFDVGDGTRTLRLDSARLVSRGKARFDIVPRREGPSRLKATFFAQNNFIRQLTVTFDVGHAPASAASVVAVGRPPASVAVLRARNLSLVISPTNAGYACTLAGDIAMRATLPILPAALEQYVDQLREALLSVVQFRNQAGEYAFQSRIDLNQSELDAALSSWAPAGRRLFDQLFFGPAADQGCNALGDHLVQLLNDPSTTLRFQIVAESTPLPWAMLYVGNVGGGAALDWTKFIGMRHIIEQIPLQTVPTVSGEAISSNGPCLYVGLNLNERIDPQMAATFVADQRLFWNAQADGGRLTVAARTKRGEVMDALATGSIDDQILYFFCHAAAKGLTDRGGPDASSLEMTDGAVRLGDLYLYAGPRSTPKLRGTPLIFINACESAELSPAFYDGFVPYFMAKGARGVIGTESKVPAIFAVAWAKRLFELLLAGRPLGDAVLALRREFQEQHRNPLGLLYAIHCNADTVIRPAVYP